MVQRRLLQRLLLVVVVLLGCYPVGTASAQPKATTKALGFSNLVFRLQGGDQLGIAGEDWRVHVLEDLRRRGFDIVGAEDRVGGGQAASVLSGTVTELTCQPGSVAANVTCRMGVEWQVLDAARNAVVYQLLTRARVLDVPKEPTTTLGKQLVVANLASLSQRPAFRSLLEPELSTGAAPARRQLVVDEADPSPDLGSSSTAVHDTRVQGTGGRKTTPLVKRGLIIWGGTAVLTGLTLVLTSVLIKSAMTENGSAGSGGEVYRTYRNIGWATTAVGGVLVGVGFALP